MDASTTWSFWIDTGGTFTDCLARTPSGGLRRLKVLSTGSVRGRIASVEDRDALVVEGLPAVNPGFFSGYTLRDSRGFGLRKIVRDRRANDLVRLELDRESGCQTGDTVDLSAGEEAPLLAMRILTDTPLGKPLPAAELRLATTRGTNAILEGKGERVAFFVTRGFGDLLRIGDQRRPDLFALNVTKPAPLHGPVVEVDERLAADGSVVAPINLEGLREQVEALLKDGIRVAAIALLHGYRNPVHEKALAFFVKDAGFEVVSVSSELAPFIKLVPRAETTVVDAMLAPVMDSYLDGVGKAVDPKRFWVMTSAGGLVRRDAYRPKDSLLSGPAGGVAGAVAVSRRAGFSRILTFDMGGTSADVARFEGDFEYRAEHVVGHARVFAPALRLETVAAGGGSICRFDGTALVVGPESAGADPGPACFGGGGPLTLTDVNLLSGRLDPAKFGVPVFVQAAEAKLEEALSDIERATAQRPAAADVLRGFLEIANERMADVIRRISVREGYDPVDYTLVAFGGAGGLHACAIAELLKMKSVLFPADSGLLSAYGLREAVPERFAERQIMKPLAESGPFLDVLLEELAGEGRAGLIDDGLEASQCMVRRREIQLRFSGQESGFYVDAEPVAEIAGRFSSAYESRYGYSARDREIEVVSLRVVVSGKPREEAAENFPSGDDVPSIVAPSVIARADLVPGRRFEGPVLVQDGFGTLFVLEGWSAAVGSGGSIVLNDDRAPGSVSSTVSTDVVELELFTCRFLALVEEMGVLLQRCAISVNVKERLDFSCALLDADGELVANAPHIPVHLGALGICVRRIRETLELLPGDVVITNHPGFGGSHLPDITLVAPVHSRDGVLLGFVANRAHHAEVGGATPGSMPTTARCLAEEGVVIAPMFVARKGSVDWGPVRELLAGGEFPSRAVDENLADLHAQFASIRSGTVALQDLAANHGAEGVRRFMTLLKQRSADALANALSRLPAGVMKARDELDDGMPIEVTCERVGGKLIVDFQGSGDVHPGNLNATPGIVNSALIYVLRLLAGENLPLNEGLLRDVELRIPRGVLSPGFPDDPRRCPAVVGGNVETSQRIVDVLMTAFGMAACSQGTMNNLVIGNESFSYYETIAGGTGAGPGFAGCDAIHSHMTNTAITDPEVFEVRQPLRLEQFAVRTGTGGSGRFAGGAGVVRRVRVLAPVSVSILAQRRTKGPPGSTGGGDGVHGEQWIERPDGTRDKLGSSFSGILNPGDVIEISTPGGGGWGNAGT